MRGRVVIASLLVACSSLSGLSGDGDGTPPATDGGGVADGQPGADAQEDVLPTSDGDAPVSAADVCGAFAAAECGRLSACLPFEIITYYGGPQSCEARANAACLHQLKAPGTKSYTKSMLDACIAGETAMSCERVTNGEEFAGCVPAGTRAVGEKCTYATQCATSFCAQVDAKGCGTCQEAAHEGELCGNGCAHGLQCVGMRCLKPGALNAPCDSVPCSKLYQCVDGTCQAYLGVGETCGGSIGCDFTQPLYCRSSDNTCVKPTVVQPGTQCAIGSICAGGMCAPSADGGAPLCTAFAGVGAACGNGPPPCQLELMCIAAQCVLPDVAYCN